MNQSRNPENLVSNIIGEKISLKNVSSQMIDTVKGLGASQAAYRDGLIWMIQCADWDELTKKLQELNRLGFLFIGGSSGWSAADVFGDLLKNRKLSDKFKEVQWRGPGDWFIIEH